MQTHYFLSLENLTVAGRTEGSRVFATLLGRWCRCPGDRKDIRLDRGNVCTHLGRVCRERGGRTSRRKQTSSLHMRHNKSGSENSTGINQWPHNETNSTSKVAQSHAGNNPLLRESKACHGRKEGSNSCAVGVLRWGVRAQHERSLPLAGSCGLSRAQSPRTGRCLGQRQAAARTQAPQPEARVHPF